MHVLLPSVREDLAVLSTVKLGPKNYLETTRHFCSGKKKWKLVMQWQTYSFHPQQLVSEIWS